MASPQEKITLYNMADLKNTTDDAIPNYLNSLKFQQTHYYTNVRLALGYAAFAVAAACFVWDYYLGWDDTKFYTQIAVVVYLFINSALNGWMQQVEKGAVYCGTAPSGEKVLISTSVDKYIPTYKVNVITVGTHEDAKPEELTFERPFNQWFDETGLFVAPPFQEAFASEVPAVGKQDPKRVKSRSQQMLDTNPELLDAVMAASNDASTTSAETGGKKGSKRRKV